MSERDHDPVNHPSHYTGGSSGIECIDAIEAAFSPEEVSGFRKINAFKYLWRAGKKGDELEDLRKAQWYLDREVWSREESVEVEADEPIQCCNEKVNPDADCMTEGCVYEDAKEKAQREYRSGIERASGRLGGEVSEVYMNGEKVPGVLAISFETNLHPSIHDWCGVDEEASVGSPHEAPTDRPHRSVDHDDVRFGALARMSRQLLRRV